MARFVPFIVDAGDNQKIGVKITRMKKTDAAQTEKEPHWQTSCLLTMRAVERLPLKQRFRSWQSTMCRIMVQVLFQVLAELRAMSFPVKLQ